MSDSNPSNVIEFTSQNLDAPVVPQHKGKSGNHLSAAEGLSLLKQTRDNLVNAVATAFAEKLGAAKRDMAQLAERARDPERASLYQSGHALLTNGGIGFLEDFRVAFTRSCDSMMALHGASGGGDPWSSADGELSLMSSTDFERDLAVGRLATKATYDCSPQLTALDRRVGLLMGVRRMEGDANPFHPKRLFNAFLDALSRHGADQRLGLILLETFAHYTIRALPAIYMDMNRQLVAAGVLEKLPIEIEERPHEAASRRRVHRDPGGDAIGDVFVQLAAGLHRSQQPPSAPRTGRRAGAPAFPGMPSMAGMYPPLEMPPAGPGAMPFAPMQPGPMAMGQVLQGLTGLQRGSQQAASTLGVSEEDLAVADPTSTEMLRRIGSSPLMRWLPPNDAVTVDLVTMLFDTILNDPEVPASLRPELGRLQVSILKAAMLNKGFFNDERHPARRLLDLIAHAGHGWGRADEPRLREAIHDAVEHVNQAFEDDTSVFTAQIEAIEGILRQADNDARDNVSELVEKLEREDRRVFVEASVSEQVEQRLDFDNIPTPVRDFIDAHWRSVMVAVYVEDGDQGAQWQEALTSLDDLIWSILPKPDPQDRHRLMAMLPGLLRRLSTAMARIDREPQWQRFLKRLMSLHMAAIRCTPASVTPIRDPATADATQPGQPAAADLAGADKASSPIAMAPDSLERDSAIPWDIPSIDINGAMRDGDNGIEPDAALAAQLGGPLQPQSRPSPEPETDAFALTVEELDIGDWVAFRAADLADNGSEAPVERQVRAEADGGTDDQADEISLRASWTSRFSGLYLFTDRRGETARILATDELAERLRQGRARVLSSATLTDRAVSQLLNGGLGAGDAKQAS